MSRSRYALLIIACAALALGGGCRRASSPGYEVFPDMARSVPYDAYDPNPVTANHQTLQTPVPGTVARGAAFHPYGGTPDEAERAGKELVNPVPASTAALARGEAVYRTFCWVCHGEQGQGDGPVIPKFPNPPAYNSERVRAMPEGRIFHVITRGTALMPPYAAQISPEDRWRLVRYVQKLQALRPATTEARR